MTTHSPDHAVGLRGSQMGMQNVDCGMIELANPPASNFRGRGTDFRGWVMHMTWHDLLFAHWPLSAEVIQSRLPRGMAVDTFEGESWLGIVPFRMTGIRLRGLPGVPTSHAFIELNVRTYVTVNDEPGVYFFSLDAPHRLPIAVARTAFRLNYHRATMAMHREADWMTFRSMRQCDNAIFVGRYCPIGEARPSDPGTLEYWLTERYRMYMADRHDRLWFADVQHQPWQLNNAEAMIDLNTMTSPLEIELPDQPPHLLFAKRMATRVGPPRRIKINAHQNGGRLCRALEV